MNISEVAPLTPQVCYVLHAEGEGAQIAGIKKNAAQRNAIHDASVAAHVEKLR